MLVCNVLIFTISATDVDGDTLTYSSANLPVRARFNITTKTFTWRPNYTQSGTYAVTFMVSDGVLSDSQVMTITDNDVCLPNWVPTSS